MAEDNPGLAVEEAVRRCLTLIDTWISWDGRPNVSEDGDRVYTPAKAVRRIADHLVDHLAEVEAVLAGAQTQPDGWHGSLVTLESDWARFTELDRDEAHQRLPRLARTFSLRLASAGPGEWDRPRAGWTLREIAEHLTGVLWYAEQVGDLSVEVVRLADHVDDPAHDLGEPVVLGRVDGSDPGVDEPPGV